MVAIGIIFIVNISVHIVVVRIPSRFIHSLSFALVEAYQDSYHRYTDAILTAKLGLGYITGVLELLLGALIYIMCLPFVRKSGHFQVEIRCKKSHDCFICFFCSCSIGVIC